MDQVTSTGSEPAAQVPATSTGEPAAQVDQVTSTGEPAAQVQATSMGEPAAQVPVTSTGEPAAQVQVTSTGEPAALVNYAALPNDVTADPLELLGGPMQAFDHQAQHDLEASMEVFDDLDAQHQSELMCTTPQLTWREIDEAYRPLL